MTKDEVDGGIMAESAQKPAPVVAESSALLHRLEGLIPERPAP